MSLNLTQFGRMITAIMLLSLMTFSAPLMAQITGGTGTGSGTGGTANNGSVVTTITSQLCGIVNGVRTVIGVIALVMFLVGGVLYAVGHFMPAAGQIKASMQGWSMGMILGGVIGVILVILAPFIISTILNFGSGLSALAC